MKITTGLFDHMVLQRNRRNRSDTTVTGETTATGTLHVRVTPGSGGWRAVGRVARGQFRFRLDGVRSGGPYVIELQVRHAGNVTDRLRVRDVLVGDVWLAGGQSNMQGCGRITGAAAPQA
ncbi:MAG: sialate O-acetylesterase, partial [bacterium]